MADLFDYLRERPYPGRGILVGTAPDGDAVSAYFIMTNRMITTPEARRMSPWRVNLS